LFESALIARAESTRQIDVGLIAETIFFYRSTHLLLNHSSLTALTHAIQIDDLLSLLDRTGTKLSYVQPSFVVVSAGTPRASQFAAVTFGGRPERRVANYKEEIAMMLERALGDSRPTRKLIKAINDRVVRHKFSGDRKENVITDLAQQDARDQRFIRNGVLTVLRHLVPEYDIPADFRFELMDTGQGYAVDTNLNYESINSIYHKDIPVSHSTINSDFLLAHLIAARADSYFAANYMAEIVTSPVYSDLIRLKHFDFLARRSASERELVQFQDTVLSDFPRLGEAINSGQRSIKEFLELLDSAEKFRDWLATVNPDQGLIRSYYRAATEHTWADKLPTKSVRFAISAGLGMLADGVLPTGLGTAAGLAVGAADSLYLDRLIKGWRPNQFIEGAYTKFVGSASNEQLSKRWSMRP